MNGRGMPVRNTASAWRCAVVLGLCIAPGCAAGSHEANRAPTARIASTRATTTHATHSDAAITAAVPEAPQSAVALVPLPPAETTAEPGIAVSPNGTRVAVYGTDLHLRIWDLRGGAVLASEPMGRADDEPWLEMDWRRSGELLGTVLRGDAGPQRLQLWNEDGRAVATPFDRAVNGNLRWTPDGSLLAVTGRDGVQLIDPVSGAVHATLRLRPSDLIRIDSFSPDGALLVVSSSPAATIGRGAGHVESDIFEIGSHRRVGRIDLSSGHSFSPGATFAWTADSTMLAMATQSGGAVVWDRATRRTRRCAIDPDPNSEEQGDLELQAVRFSPDGSMLAGVVMEPKALLVWDARTCALVRRFDVEGQALSEPEFSADGAQIISALGESDATFWDVRTGHVVRSVRGASGRLFRVGERMFALDGNVELAISRMDDGATLFIRPVTIDGRAVSVAAMRDGLFAGEPAAVAQLSYRVEGSTRVRSGSSLGPGYLRPSLVEDFFAGRDVSPPRRAASAR